MPEGPEIRRAADRLEKAVKGKPLTDAWFAFPHLQPFAAGLTGERVETIETRGKALLTHFSNGLTLYSHNQLYGVWRVVNADEHPESTRILRVRLQTEDKAILLYSASDIDILTAEQLAQHPFLLAFLAGLGNYLRVEILWHCALAPTHKAAELTDAQLDAFADALLAIPRLSYNTRGRVSEKKHHGALFKFNVFHRAGKKCARCGGIIEKTTLSSRPFYWCPGCQH